LITDYYGNGVRAKSDRLLEWVDWFNNRRLLGTSGNVPPAEFESAYHRQQDESAMVA
jgi:transposase InsO family protein